MLKFKHPISVVPIDVKFINNDKTSLFVNLLLTKKSLSFI